MDDDDALLAVGRTAYRQAIEQGGGIVHMKDAVRAEVQRAGFFVMPDDEDMTTGIQTVIVTLADRRYVQRNAWDRWAVWRYPDTVWFGPERVG